MFTLDLDIFIQTFTYILYFFIKENAHVFDVLLGILVFYLQLHFPYLFYYIESFR